MNTNITLKLMLRDLRAYQKNFLMLSGLMLAVGMLIIFVNSNAVGMFTGSTNTIVTVIIGVYLIELKNKGVWVHTASLPVTRKAMIISRFCTSLLVVTLNLVLWIGVFYLLVETVKPEWRGLVGIEAIAYSWIYLLFQLALFFLAFYRFNIIVVLGLYILPTILWTVFTPKPAAMGVYVLEDAQLFFTWTLRCVGFFSLAYVSTLNYFKRKDL